MTIPGLEGAEAWDRAERWLVRLGAFALPLVISWNTFDQYILPKVVFLRILIVVFAALFLGRLLFTARLSWKRTRIDLPLLAFLASAGISTIFAINVNTALFGNYGRYEGLLTLASYAAVFWLTVQLLKDERDATGLIHAMLASAYVVSILAVVQAVSGTQESVAAGVCLTRPYTTFGQPVPMGAFLAMLLPAAFSEVLRPTTLAIRVLAANVCIVMGIALLLTLSRGAWIGAALGLVIVFIASRPSLRVVAAVAAGLAVALGLAIVLAGSAPASGSPLNACQSRLASLTEPSSGSAGIRIHLWGDSLRLMASRPLLGYGPENFALAYPRFQSGDWDPGFVLDKAHSDILQVAATQGLAGAAIEIWLLAAFVRAYSRGHRRGLASGMFGGWLAYQVAMQVGFSWVPSSAPFWIFAAAAITMWRSESRTVDITLPAARWRAVIPIGATCLIAVAVLTGPIRGYLADIKFLDAVKGDARNDRDGALAAAVTARQLAPEQWVYAIEEGNLDLDLNPGGVPGPRADWQRARAAYQDAISLGTSNTVAFRYLALVDLRLGLRQEAEAAARRAVELNRYDPANGAVLKYVLSAPA